jgi:hypothetical protein
MKPLPVLLSLYAAGQGFGAKPSGSKTLISYSDRPPSLVIDLEGVDEARRTREHRLKTPQGVVTVRVRPPKESSLPQARNAEIQWPMYLQVVVIISPRSVPVKIRLPILPNHSKERIRVNNRMIATRGDGAGGVWSPTLTGGYNRVVIPSTDAE